MYIHNMLRELLVSFVIIVILVLVLQNLPRPSVPPVVAPLGGLTPSIIVKPPADDPNPNPHIDPRPGDPKIRPKPDRKPHIDPHPGGPKFKPGGNTRFKNLS